MQEMSYSLEYQIVLSSDFMNCILYSFSLFVLCMRQEGNIFNHFLNILYAAVYLNMAVDMCLLLL
jgi:hypothetical protein